jgi:acetyl esterase/lipase
LAARPGLSRRALLGALGGAALVAGCSENSPGTSAATHRPAAGSTKVTYGIEHPDQYGVLGLPSIHQVGTAILVHGGYWSAQYGLDLMEPMAAALQKLGFATWNIEYRRIGSGGGFPATFADVAAAYDKVAELDVLGGQPVVALGHSAGGHLAVWAASRTPTTPGGTATITPTTTVSLSGVLDLSAAATEDLGGGATQALMGGGPDEVTYPQADPSQMVPAKGRIVAVHAKDDEIVPADQSTTYVRLDHAAGGDAQLVTVPGGHFDLIDPTSASWKQIVTLVR